MFKTITTDWVYNPHPLLNNKQRFVGPAWVAWLIVRAQGKRLYPLLQRAIAFLFKLSGAHYEIQQLTESEIVGKRVGVEFIRQLKKTVYAGSVARGATFSGLSGIINTGAGPGTESADAPH